ncbi:MAG: beta/alpha barrel domain-containing protein [Thermoplasmataceae archaeon]
MKTTVEVLRKSEGIPCIVVSIIPQLKMNFETVFSELGHFNNIIPEFRFDLMEDADFSQRLNKLKELKDMDQPSIITYRSVDTVILNRFYSSAMESENFIIDIDGFSLHDIQFKIIVDRTIISYHINEIPSGLELVSHILKAGYKAVKLAVHIRDETSLFELIRDISFLKNNGEILSLVPMGDDSGIMRLISALTVSDFAYFRFGKETGRGQSRYDKFGKILEMIRGMS